ncbi:hypothetical protein [Mesorhizobium sp.]|uniref:hypothetical protein n=1 Tax=Mesorhizobium sp. TaxID=1871066 RepID=UPI00122B130D|nr:hypothetical protein [Mesorhizobium sp.]TIM81781.1 MAG: hypothetical protein E5Y50_31880 [Mesorhizobium sp.]
MSQDFFGLSLKKIAADRAHQFWLLGIDSQQRTLVDLLGNIDTGSMAIINERFFDTDAGFRISAQKALKRLPVRADIFLLNTDYFEQPAPDVDPMLVHEICHGLDQLNLAPPGQITDLDRHNAQVIFEAYDREAWSAGHNGRWGQYLAWSGRRSVELGRTASISEFIKLSIPAYDRPNWQDGAIREK